MAPAAGIPMSFGLIDLSCYITYRRNSTVACTKTSIGLPIYVSMCTAPPPALSQVCVHCPGLGLDEKEKPPRVICTDADLVVLRVPLETAGMVNQICCDYFVYRAHPERPNLDLLPNPCPARFGDDEIGILSRGDGRYVVASLRFVPSGQRIFNFNLHLYRSTDYGGSGRWTSQLLSVEEPLRDRVCPILDDVDIDVYHMNNGVIILGGDEGSIGWVDLWRGILICDVLSDTPKLRDMPLPMPARRNWTIVRNRSPHFYRSIAVNPRRNTIKYVELETTLPRKVPFTSSRPEPISFFKWVYSHHQDDDQECLPGRWTATTYSMPIPVVSWHDWRRDCSLRLADIKLPDGNARQSRLLCRLMSTKKQQQQQEASTKATSSLGFVSMAYPALTAGDDDGCGDVIYLLSKGRTGMEAVIAINPRERAVQGVAKLHTQRHVTFQRCFLATGGPSKHTMITGTGASFGQADEEHMQKDPPKSKVPEEVAEAQCV